MNENRKTDRFATIIEDDSVIVSRTHYNMLSLMTNDFMKAEEYLNQIGIETRCEDNDDEFLSMKDIVEAIKKLA